MPRDAAEALIAAVGNDLRELAAACSQLVADTDGRIDAETVARYYRGRVEVTGFTVADATMVGDVPGCPGGGCAGRCTSGSIRYPFADALADGVRTVGPGRLGRTGQRLSARQQPGHARRGRSSGPQRQGRGWTPEGLVTAMRAAAECNAAVKGGADDRAYALERGRLLGGPRPGRAAFGDPSVADRADGRGQLSASLRPGARPAAFVNPGGVLCFLFFEGAVALAVAALARPSW